MKKVYNASKMDKTNFDIAILVGKYLGGTLTGEEKEQLERWLVLSEKNRVWFERVTAESYRIKKEKILVLLM